MNFRLSATRGLTPAARGDRGYTLTEILVASLISVTLAAAITGVVLSSLSLVGRQQANVATTAFTQDSLVSLEALARDASRVKVATPTQLKFTYQREDKCELHTYTFDADPSNLNALRLRHAVAAADLPPAGSCSDVDTALVAGTIAATSTATEISNLGSSSRFYYYGDAGTQVLVAGDTGYDATAAVNVCRIGSTRIVLVVNQNSEGSKTTQTQEVVVAFRSNVMGVSC